MTRTYRTLAAILILLGALVIVWTVSSAYMEMVTTQHMHPIRCDQRGCRAILPDGSLADDEVIRPGGTR